MLYEHVFPKKGESKGDYTCSYYLVGEPEVIFQPSWSKLLSLPEQTRKPKRFIYVFKAFSLLCVNFRGVGLEVAKRLLSEVAPGVQLRLCLACRNQAKAKGAKGDLLKDYPHAKIDMLPVDTSDPQSCLNAAKDIIEKYDENSFKLIMYLLYRNLFKLRPLFRQKLFISPNFVIFLLNNQGCTKSHAYISAMLRCILYLYSDILKE